MGTKNIRGIYKPPEQYSKVEKSRERKRFILVHKEKFMSCARLISEHLSFESEHLYFFNGKFLTSLL